MELEGRVLLAVDATKASREAGRMPGARKLFRESENSSEAQYVFGHLFGAVGVPASSGRKTFCVPAGSSIQDGVAQTPLREGGDGIRAYPASCRSREAPTGRHKPWEDALTWCLTATSPPSLPQKRPMGLTHAATRKPTSSRAKGNAEAFAPPPERTGKHRGRPRRKGKTIKPAKSFGEPGAGFRQEKVALHGKVRDIDHLCTDLVWGTGLHRPVRFVSVEQRDGKAILASADATPNPSPIVEAHAKRFETECAFRELEQRACASGRRFWAKSMPRLSRYRKKDGPDPLKSVAQEKDRRRILETIEAIERFATCPSIATGISQTIALDPKTSNRLEETRCLRTSRPNCVSEATVMDYPRKHIFRVLLSEPKSWLTRFVLEIREHDIGDFELNLAA